MPSNILFITKKDIKSIKQELGKYISVGKIQVETEREKALSQLKENYDIAIIDGEIEWCINEVMEEIGEMKINAKKIIVSKEIYTHHYLEILELGYSDCLKELNLEDLTNVIIKTSFNRENMSSEGAMIDELQFTLFNNLEVGVLIVDNKLNIFNANHIYIDYIGADNHILNQQLCTVCQCTYENGREECPLWIQYNELSVESKRAEFQFKLCSSRAKETKYVDVVGVRIGQGTYEKTIFFMKDKKIVNIESEKLVRYELLFKNSLEMIIYFDKFGKVIDYNEVANTLLEYQGDDMLKVTARHIFNNMFKIVDGIMTYPEADLDKVVRSNAYRRNTTCFPIEVKVNRNKLEDEGIWIVIARDISKSNDMVKKLSKINEQLEKQTKIRNEFVANVTHELRTPVNGMKGMTKTLLDTELTNEQKETVNIIENCCVNMIKIINDLLDFSKIEAGKMSIEEHEFDFYEMMDKIKKFNMVIAKNKGLTLKVNIGNKIPNCLIGDDLRITQIINNLLSNAIKFTTIGSVFVEVVATQIKNGIVDLFFMVIDTGIGISKEDKDKLFKSFSQVDASHTRQYGGTGLGLSICMSLVKMMGGNINVTSEKGTGSSFSFNIKLRIAGNNSEKEQIIEEMELPELPVLPKIEILKKKESIMDIVTEIKSVNKIKGTMGKLKIAITTSSIVKAELLAKQLKVILKEVASSDINRMMFKMELKIRKEDFETAIEMYQELDKKLSEVNYYE